MQSAQPPCVEDNDPFLLLESVDLELVLRHLSDSVFVSDAEGRILLLNPACQQLLGIRIDGVQDVSVQQLMAQGVYEPSTALEAARRKATVTALVRSHKGYDMMAVSRPVLDKYGNVIMVVTSSRSKQHIDEFLANALQEEKRQTDRYRQAASVLSESLQQDKPVAASPAMKSVLTLADSVARSEATVLLSGESGTGKEVLAHYVHHASLRSGEPFIPVNCGAAPQDLMESEFFGYVKGAFTGANPRGKAGLFEMAHQGTLFLDEISEMPLPMQAKLLRVLETGMVRRLGDTRSYGMNVRIIAATNQDLLTLVAEGRFRRDLYYRLHVIPVNIPPLRERPEDIRELAKRFLQECNKRHNQRKTLTAKALEALTRYDWPGNVRELRNTVERLAIMPGQNRITEEICSALLLGPGHRPYAPLVPEPGTLSLREFRRQAEGEYIRKTLAANKGNVLRTAHSLGIHKTALYRKMHALGILAGSVTA